MTDSAVETSNVIKPTDAPTYVPGDTPMVAPATPVAETASATPSLNAFFSIPVNLEIVLASVKMPVSKLMDLKVGSEIDLSHPAGAEVALLVNGSKIAFGHLFLIDPQLRNVGIKISRLANPAREA